MFFRRKRKETEPESQQQQQQPEAVGIEETSEPLETQVLVDETKEFSPVRASEDEFEFEPDMVDDLASSQFDAVVSQAVPPSAPPEEVQEETVDESQTDERPERRGFLGRLAVGLSKTSSQLSSGIGAIFTKRKLDADMLEELEDLLIMSDMGANAAATITQNFGKGRFDKEISAEDVRLALAQEITTILTPAQQPLVFDVTRQPTVVMVVGVNGNGKTTTIGKLAERYKREGKTVMLAAVDTFRAAAVEQLRVWAERADVPIVTGEHEADPASVAYTALERARREQVDILLIDTAGRLQNKQNLMEELSKISRVLRKLDEDAPHHTLMVLDGTTGQNAISQAKKFGEFVDVSGFAITKLDGTAKGGVVVALAEAFDVPVHYVGVGEGIEDLQDFHAEAFAKSLVGAVSIKQAV